MSTSARSTVNMFATGKIRSVAPEYQIHYQTTQIGPSLSRADERSLLTNGRLAVRPGTAAPGADWC